MVLAKTIPSIRLSTLKLALAPRLSAVGHLCAHDPNLNWPATLRWYPVTHHRGVGGPRIKDDAATGLMLVQLLMRFWLEGITSFFS